MKTKTLLVAVLLSGAALAQAASIPFAWGTNFYGQIGDSTSTNRLSPVTVTTTGVLAGKTIIAVSAGQSHALALTADGLVFSWGINLDGALGDGSISFSSTTPVVVDMSGVLAGKVVTAIAAGNGFSIALTSDGKLYSWGDNAYNQLGNGSSTDSSVPVLVDMSGVLSGKVVTAISAHANNVLVLTADNKLFTWGANHVGQLGNGSTTASSVPVAVDMSGVLAGKTITAIAGGGHCLVATSTGKVYAWGANYYGNLGNGTTVNSHTPVAVTMTGALSGKTVVGVSVGHYHSVALTADGLMYGWGDNTYGQLGDGTSTASTTPVAVDTAGVLSGRVISAMDSGGVHSLALTDDGNLFAWGYNPSGGIGDGSTTDRFAPVAVDMSGTMSGYAATTVSAGTSFSLALAAPVITTITPANRFTYAANFGWLNWRTNPLATDAPVIETTLLHGKVYSANVGWIDLGDGTPSSALGSYTQTGGDVGVNHDGAGNLSGYAYGANIGWIYFDPTIASPPRVNLTTGAFSGYAYSANCGWLHLGGITTRLHPGPDLDILVGGGTGDGIADSWEIERGNAAGHGNNLNLLGTSSTSDYDGDGVSDLDEYRADTNPFSAGDRFRVSAFNYNPANGNIDLNWSSSARRAYKVLCSSDLVTWTQVGSTQIGGTSTLQLTGPAASHLFFRLAVDVPLGE